MKTHFYLCKWRVGKVPEFDTFGVSGVMSLLNPIKLGEMEAVSLDVLGKIITCLLYGFYAAI